MAETFNLITFDTTHYSISADKCLDEINMLHKLIPMPQEVSAGCGFCLRVEPEDYKMVREELASREIEVAGCYSVEKTGLKSRYTKIEE